MKNELRQGVPKAVVARKYGVSRQSIYNILNEKTGLHKERAERGSLLDPFKGFIDAKLADFDVPATSLFQEVRRQGYAGGLTTVKDYVRIVKGEQVRQVIERFETVPGRQAQIDWGECGTITVNGERRKLYVFVLVLGYSRLLFARFTTSMRQPVLLTLLREVFEQIGVPQELLVDNMKTAVDKHAIGESVRFNSSFLDFCEHYGTTPLACPPYWPRAKGKVEAGVKFVKNSFLTGRSFTTLDDLNQHHLASTIGTDLSHETISKITDEILDEVLAWQSRPLEALYPVIYLDALVVKVKDGAVVKNKSAHIAIGVDMDGIKHVLGIWVQATEGAKFWGSVCAELSNRGVKDVLILCCDGLNGLPEAIQAML